MLHYARYVSLAHHSCMFRTVVASLDVVCIAIHGPEAELRVGILHDNKGTVSHEKLVL